MERDEVMTNVKKSFRLRVMWLSALLMPIAATQAAAQDFPTKPVRIITPFPVGSGPEGVVRLLADKL